METFRSLCPNCQVELTRFPADGERCPSCDQIIYFRVVDGILCFLGEDELAEFEASVTSTEAPLSISKSDFEKAREELGCYFEGETINVETIWNEYTEELKNKLQDPGSLSLLYRETAYMQYKSGNDFLFFLRFSQKFKLLSLKLAGEVSVQIKGGCCPSCDSLDGQVFPIEKALEQMPLPCPTCSNQAISRTGWCICTYEPVDETEILATSETSPSKTDGKQ